MRTAAAILAGYVVWTAIWLLGNASLRASETLPAEPGTAISSPVGLVVLLLLSLACSLAAGWTARATVRAPATRAPVILGVLLLATGIAVQAETWALMPLWYHLLFLGLLIPATLFGASLGRKPA